MSHQKVDVHVEEAQLLVKLHIELSLALDQLLLGDRELAKSFAVLKGTYLYGILLLVGKCFWFSYLKHSFSLVLFCIAFVENIQFLESIYVVNFSLVIIDFFKFILFTIEALEAAIGG